MAIEFPFIYDAMKFDTLKWEFATVNKKYA
jgi:hypothetical protein